MLVDFYVPNNIQHDLWYLITLRSAVAMMAYYTILCCQCEREFRWPQRQHEQVWERQRLECQVPPSYGGSETKHFSANYFCGVLFSSPFFHPPSILPISSSWVESVAYLSLEMHLFSHEIWRKNFTPSSFEIEVVSLFIFCCPERYWETKIFSSSSKKYPSIFSPRVRRYVLGKSIKILNQNE